MYFIGCYSATLHLKHQKSTVSFSLKVNVTVKVQNFIFYKIREISGFCRMAGILYESYVRVLYFVLCVCVELEEVESEEAHRAAIAHRLRDDVVGLRVGVVAMVMVTAQSTLTDTVYLNCLKCVMCKCHIYSNL